MTPRLATKLTIHDPTITGQEVGDSDGAVAARGLVALPSRQFGLVQSPDHAVTSPRQREALRRRLLCAADVLTAAAALVLVLTVLGHDRPTLVTLFGIPVLILLFKVGGLYDREQVRVLRSTLDEAPVILQLAGLYALAVTILRPLVVKGTWAAPRSRACGCSPFWRSSAGACAPAGWPAACPRSSAAW